MISRKFFIQSEERQQLIRIDKVINDWLIEKKLTSGICFIFVDHSTAALCITNKKDPATAEDVTREFDRIVPTRVDFLHRMDTPRDAAGHIKTAMVGVDLTCPVNKGQLVLGKAQGIFFCEFDGPRKRAFTTYFLNEEITEFDECHVSIEANYLH